jgi:hypothetical protein
MTTKGWSRLLLFATFDRQNQEWEIIYSKIGIILSFCGMNLILSLHYSCGLWEKTCAFRRVSVFSSTRKDLSSGFGNRTRKSRRKIDILSPKKTNDLGSNRNYCNLLLDVNHHRPFQPISTKTNDNDFDLGASKLFENDPNMDMPKLTALALEGSC